MARALIKINGSDSQFTAVTIGSTVNLSNHDEGGETTYGWTIVDQPEGTADNLSATNLENVSFTPTKEGSYELQLVVNALLPTKATQGAVVCVLDARTHERIPAATETTESGSRGWAAAANRILGRTLHAAVDGNLIVATTPGGIAAGAIVKLNGVATVNSGSQSQFTAVQIASANALVTISDRIGIVIDGVVAGDLGAGKLVQVRTFGLVPFAGSGSPSVGDAVYLSDTGTAVLTPGTVTRRIGHVVQVGGGSYQWVFDGVPITALPTLAAIATSGSASDLSAGTVPAARMPALTGDVTSSAGSVATTIASHVVTYAKQAQAAANTLVGNNTGGTADKTDLTVSQVAAMLTTALGVTSSGNYGPGSDGVVTLDGAATVPWASLAANVYTMTREAFPSSLTINNGVTLKPVGFPLRVKGALVNNGIISFNGGNGGNGGTGGASGAAGAASSSAGFLPGGTAGGAGGVGGTGGTAGTASGGAPQTFDGTAAAGGTAGNVGTNGGTGHGAGGGGGGGINCNGAGGGDHGAGGFLG